MQYDSKVLLLYFNAIYFVSIVYKVLFKIR